MSRPATASPDVLEQLTAVLGAEAVLTGGDIGDRYRHDWSNAASGGPLAVLRPGSTHQVADILKICNAHAQPIVVQGGLTGLSGGAVPNAGEIALSLERMHGIEELDAPSMTLTALAGTPLQTIHEAADAAGLAFPLDLGARGSCNIGGNIATNAGGNQVLRFGMARNLVLGLEAVLADGTVISSLNRMLKNNAGYDLKHLFIGTEGTLGVVTRAVLRLFPKARSCCSALVALNSFDDTIRFLQYLGSQFGGSLSRFEVMWASYLDFIVEHVESARSPFDRSYPVYVLTEIEGGDPEADASSFANALAAALDLGLLVDAVIAQNERERQSFWAIRDGVADIGEYTKHSANFDVSVPISRMADFLDRIRGELESAFTGLTSLYFGHIGDNNLHLTVWTEDKADTPRLYDTVYRITGDFGGSVSGEHGIGRLKIPYLKYSRNDPEIALMRRLKATLDPNNILNPGRVVLLQ